MRAKSLLWGLAGLFVGLVIGLANVPKRAAAARQAPDLFEQDLTVFRIDHEEDSDQKMIWRARVSPVRKVEDGVVTQYGPAFDGPSCTITLNGGRTVIVGRIVD